MRSLVPSGNSISTFVIFFDGVTFSVTRIGMKVFDEDTFGFLIALLLRLLYSHFPKVKYFILCCRQYSFCVIPLLFHLEIWFAFSSGVYLLIPAILYFLGWRSSGEISLWAICSSSDAYLNYIEITTLISYKFSYHL